MISLGTLDELVYLFKAENGNLISKGALVVMKSKEKNRLYILDGSVEIDHACLATTSDGDKTLLWHRRLVHLSDSC